ncbi:MAG: hypothetical protein IJ436_00270 [Bacteroidaceae bacterium]|nr:hypothetical protein [Bacteroidaceae bacterium]
MRKRILLIICVLAVNSVAFSQFVQWGQMQYYDNSYNSHHNFNMTNHMINTYQNIGAWQNYLNQMQMQQMQQMYQNGIQYQQDYNEGRKQREAKKKTKCSNCSGTGKVTHYHKSNGKVQEIKLRCSFCHGTGKSEN